MNTEHLSQTSAKKSQKKSIEIDDFQLSEESFKPMTKGLGFHHEPKKQAFKPAPQESKPIVHTKSLPSTSVKANASGTTRSQSQSFVPMADLSKDNQKATNTHIPSGLEAFYSTNNSALVNNNAVDSNFFEEKSKTTSTKTVKKYQQASGLAQFSAYFIDILLICSFVIFTAALLVLASGIEFSMYSRIISTQDLAIFAVAMFSIYYLLYFTILDASSTPGKTIFGLKLIKTDGRPVAVKDSFFRAIISLVSGIALFLPLMLDFHGKLTDTKVVK